MQLMQLIPVFTTVAIIHRSDLEITPDNLHYEKYRNFHLISWCGNFVERHSFRIVSAESPKTMGKLCLSTKFPHQEIRWKLRYFLQCSLYVFVEIYSKKIPPNAPCFCLSLTRNRSQLKSFNREASLDETFLGCH